MWAKWGFESLRGYQLESKYMADNNTNLKVNVKQGFNVQEVVSFLEAAGAKVVQVVENVIHAIASRFLINHVQSHPAVSSVTVTDTNPAPPSPASGVPTQQNVPPPTTVPPQPPAGTINPPEKA